MMKCFSIFSSKRRDKSYTKVEEEHNLRKFSFSELRKATNNFSRLLKIGEDEFGCVYKGSIRAPDGQGDRLVVAIKNVNRNGMQDEEWLAEVQFLGVVEHPNLVKLLGYCLANNREEGIERLLVHEYLPNKSLEDHLCNRALPPIPWRKRLQILLGVAEGLAYLHEGLEIQVIFCVFNSANVLLDENFNPKLSDFGFDRGLQVECNYTMLMHEERIAYYAPEYLGCGRLTSSNNLWSFGVVLYQILSGRKANDRNLPQSEQILIEWVKLFPADSKRFQMIMDPRLNNKYSLVAARNVAKLADSCLRDNPTGRPKMSQIFDVLQDAIRESEE